MSKLERLAKKSLMAIITLVCVSASANTYLTPGTATYKYCKSTFLFMSCEKEQVAIPTMIDDGEDITFIYLGKNKGYQGKFNLNNIKKHRKKKSCLATQQFTENAKETLYFKCTDMDEQH